MTSWGKERSRDPVRQPDAAPPEELPIRHRLVVLYVMAPLLIWLVGWFEWWFGIPAALLLGLGLRPALVGSWRVAPDRMLAGLLLVAAAWVMVSSAGGVFDVHNFDWIKHRLVFLELGRGSWPTTIASYVDAPGYLRYYLGYYMAPGLAARALGPGALNWAVPLWTWCGAALMLALFAWRFRGWAVIAAAALLVFFSGMDIVRTVLIDGTQWLALHVSFDGWPYIGLGRSPLDWGGNFGLALQYTSPFVAMLWTPQHLIGAALAVLSFVQLCRHPRFLAVSGVLVAAILFWSPMVGLGLLPFVAALFIVNGVRRLLSWQNLLLAPPLALLLVGFLLSGAVGALPHGWLWTVYENVAPKLPKVIPALYLSEFLVAAALLCVLRPRLVRDPFFLAGLATLLLIPWYKFGLWNDLMTRGALPALVLLAYFVAHVIVGNGSELVRTGRLYQRAALGGLAVVLGIGAVTPLFDLARSNNDHDFSVVRYGEFGADYSLVSALGARFHNQYLTYEQPRWLDFVLRDPGEDIPRLDLGERLTAADYAIHRVENRLVYIKERCDDAEVGTRFFLHLFPLNPGDAPGMLHGTLDFNFPEYGWRAQGDCFAVRDLPWYPVGRIRTGQIAPSGAGHAWIAHYYAPPYVERVLAEAGEPLLRAGFSVHRRKNALYYVKDSCSAADADARFRLQVTPVDQDDLWDKSDGAQFDVFDFVFSEVGARTGEDCFAEIEIPDYPIKEIRTGQYGADGSLAWEATVAVEQ